MKKNTARACIDTRRKVISHGNRLEIDDEKMQESHRRMFVTQAMYTNMEIL